MKRIMIQSLGTVSVCLITSIYQSAISASTGFLKSVMLVLLLMAGNVVQAQWSQLGTDLDGESGEDDSGTSISLSADGSIIAIGAPDNDNGGINTNNFGHVRVYAWDGSSWNQRGLDINGGTVDDKSGWSVSLSSDGSRLAVGAPGLDANTGYTSVYEWDGSSWNQLGVDITGSSAGANAGTSVSLSSDGNLLAVGAPDDDDGANNAGHVRVYAWDGSSWNQLGADIDGSTADDKSGWSVSLSSDGSRLAVGAPGLDANTGYTSVYEWDGSSWNQLGADITGSSAGANAGTSVSLSSDGNLLAVGAPDDDDGANNAGHVRVYAWDGSSWNQLGADIDGSTADDKSGWSVSLSSDGRRLAVGAPGLDANTGYTSVYEWDGSSWNQLGADIVGEIAADNAGTSVSLSSDGSRVGIGAPDNNGTASNAGHARVYDGFPIPTNDDCDNATTFSFGGSGLDTLHVNVEGARIDSNETSGDHTGLVWYTFTTTEEGTYTIMTSNLDGDCTGDDVAMEVFTGADCMSLSSLTGGLLDDDGTDCNNHETYTTAVLPVGTVVYVAVGRFDDGNDIGDPTFVLEVRLTTLSEAQDLPATNQEQVLLLLLLVAGLAGLLVFRMQVSH